MIEKRLIMNNSKTRVSISNECFGLLKLKFPLFRCGYRGPLKILPSVFRLGCEYLLRERNIESQCRILDAAQILFFTAISLILETYILMRIINSGVLWFTEDKTKR